MISKHKPNISVCLLVLKTVHLEQSRAFYEIAGLTFVQHKHGTGAIHYCSEDLGFAFELYPTKHPIKNYYGLGIWVSNLEATRARFASLGIACSEIRTTGYGTLFVVRDPDDNRVEVYEAKD